MSLPLHLGLNWIIRSQVNRRSTGMTIPMVKKSILKRTDKVLTTGKKRHAYSSRNVLIKVVRLSPLPRRRWRPLGFRPFHQMNQKRRKSPPMLSRTIELMINYRVSTSRRRFSENNKKNKKEDDHMFYLNTLAIGSMVTALASPSLFACFIASVWDTRRRWFDEAQKQPDTCGLLLTSHDPSKDCRANLA